jgi:hypothetical protein
MRFLATLPLIFLFACGGGSGNSPSAPSAPTIDTFTATPSVITVGESSTLAWTARNATTLTLNGSAVSTNSSIVSPTVTTTYTLVAMGSGQTSATVTVTVGNQAPKYGDFHGADLGVGANLNGAVAFTAANAWNRDISSDPVDPNSANILASIGLSTGLHPDFGSGLWEGAPIGIP